MTPTSLIDTLNHMRRRVKVLAVFAGLGLVLATLAAALVGTVLLDYLLNLPAWPRLVLMLGALGVVAYLKWKWVLVPLRSRLTLGDVATRVEANYPIFEDRLSSTVNFLTGHDADGAGGSTMLRGRVIDQTTVLADRYPIREVVQATPAVRNLAAGLGALALVVLLGTLAVTPEARGIIASRLFTPFEGQAWPRAYEIAVVGETPARVPVGQRLDVRIRLDKGDPARVRPVLNYRYGDGPVRQEFMTLAEDGSFAASIDARPPTGQEAGTLVSWVEAGDDEEQLPPVAVVPRLAIVAVELEHRPPPYVTDQTARTVDLTESPAVVGEGSPATLRVRFNKPLGDEPVHLQPVREGSSTPALFNTRLEDRDAAVVGQFTALSSSRFRVLARDTDGYTNNALEEFELIVRPDQPPAVQIEQPRRNESRTAEAVVPLEAVAEDDYGIQDVTLVVRRVVLGQDDGRPADWRIPLVQAQQATADVGFNRVDSTGENLRHRISLGWELARLGELQPGDVLEYHLEATDNFFLNGRRHDPVSSGRLRITIVSQQQLTARAIDELRQLRSELEQVAGRQEQVQQETQDFARDTAEREALDDADRNAAERLVEQQSTAASATKRLAGRMDDVRRMLEENRSGAEDLKGLAEDLRRRLDRTAEENMKEATGKLAEAARPQQPDEDRKQDLQEAQNQQEQAKENLDAAMERMEAIGTLQTSIERMRALLEQQRSTSQKTAEAGQGQLGKKPEEMDPQQREKLEEAAREQERLADDISEALNEMQEQAQEMKESDPAAAQAMEQAARRGQQQQLQRKAREAAQQARQNQQSGAQSAQQQVELGLEMVLNELREAERRKLQQLQKELRELEEQVAVLIRRQAGHNLENLLLRGEEAVGEAGEEAVTQLRQLSQLPEEAEADAAVMTAGQTQTARNARDLAETAREMEDGAAPATRINRAAGRMERAVVHLRERELSEAYAPPQAEALAALLEAQEVVREQREQVEEQMAQQQREAVRDRFIKLRDEQQKLADETKRLETARDAAGNLPRAELIKLGQLPGEQGKLKDEIDALGEDLAAVGGVVYLWANKDIAELMEEAKGLLAGRSTDEVTQVKHDRIVKQLGLMIENLELEQLEEKFEQAGGGGGSGNGQGGGPRLPSEVELKLLQALQLDVNEDTKAAADDPVKEETFALGKRQGELRNLLDELLQQASQGETKLGPEPDAADLLPEEADEQAVEEDELMGDLLGGGEGNENAQDRKVNLVGDRMARSRQRLALNNDPGKTTQIIQERIVIDIQSLIEQAQQQRQNPQSQQQQMAGQQQQQLDEQQQQAMQQGQPQQQPGQAEAGQEAAQESGQGPAGQAADASADIRETAAEWGSLSPRERQAIIDSRGEEVVEEYRKLIEDYYRALAQEGQGR
ncbi:MAG: hypothetical protein ACFCVE_00925 [Phycisphaerae bacterium]